MDEAAVANARYKQRARIDLGTYQSFKMLLARRPSRNQSWEDVTP